MSDNKTQGDLYIGHGVVAHGVALVPGRAVVNGIFDGAIDSKELEIQTDGVVHSHWSSHQQPHSQGVAGQGRAGSVSCECSPNTGGPAIQQLSGRAQISGHQ